MKTVALILSALVVALAVGLSQGQEQPKSQAGLVAVVDLDRAAKESGANFQYLSSMAAVKQEAEQKIKDLKARLEPEIRALDEQFKAEAVESRKEEIRKKVAEKQQQFQSALIVQQNQVTQADLAMKQAFRKSLDPLLKKLSDAHGGRVILVKGNDTAYVPPNADLTDELLAELKSHPIDLPRADVAGPKPPSSRPEGK